MTNITSDDGNCLFRAFAREVYGNRNRQHQVRQECFAQMTAVPGLFRYVSWFDNRVTGQSDLASYIRRHSRDGQWGDIPEIDAMSIAYNVRVVVVVEDHRGHSIGADIPVVRPGDHILSDLPTDPCPCS